MVATTDRQLGNVLIAVDLSAACERLLHRVALLPLAAGATLELIHVLPDGMPADVAVVAERKSAERLAELRSELQSLARATDQAATVTYKIATGHQPYVEIIRRSRDIGADLVVLGREGRKRWREHISVRSTPKHVIRKGDVPVLVVTPDSAGPYQRPVVAIDLSDTSRRVVDLSRQLLGPAGTEDVSLLHAYHIPFEGWLKEEGTGRDLKATAAAHLEVFREQLGDPPRRWRPVLRKGAPEVIVLSEAARRRADLIVVGTHGRSGVANALVGSVAESVVAEAICDVAVTSAVRHSFDSP